MNKTPTTLIIMDGFGIAPPADDNAVTLAKTPVLDRLFQEYAQWLFDLLQEFDKRADMSHYSVEGYRTPGHLAERLTGIFIDYKRKTCPELVVREVPCVLFRKPERNIPLSKPDKAGLVPVVFAANNGFVGPLSVAIKSLLLHASPERFYDIVVLESDITAQNKSMLSGMVAQYPNAQLRYFNAVSKLEGYTLTAHAHISVETFYRFLIQSVMPDYDKVLYLDGDIVIQGDVAELYDTDSGFLLGQPDQRLCPRNDEVCRQDAEAGGPLPLLPGRRSAAEPDGNAQGTHPGRVAGAGQRGLQVQRPGRHPLLHRGPR